MYWESSQSIYIPKEKYGRHSHSVSNKRCLLLHIFFILTSPPSPPFSVILTLIHNYRVISHLQKGVKANTFFLQKYSVFEYALSYAQSSVTNVVMTDDWVSSGTTVILLSELHIVKLTGCIMPEILSPIYLK